ncbi:Gfo/Idh/MocA family protein [Halovulum sp. GXIMD14794]
MSGTFGVGIMGCGHISEIYMANIPAFGALHLVACADIRPEAAKAKAAAHGIVALTPEALLADDGIDIVLNLTTPAHHKAIACAALSAGKHVYGEKPLALDVIEGREILALAEQKALTVGSAPDTFLGGAHQTARAAIDAGRIGRPLSGMAVMMVPGHERWHHNPEFYYQPGGGPLYDMGPYYLTALVNMLGPVARVVGIGGKGFASRTIGTGPKAGTSFPVEIDSHVAAVLEFAQGAIVSMVMSFDVKAHSNGHIEIYGTEGSLSVSDPNRFDGPIRLASVDREWSDLDQTHCYGDGNYRGLGLADMANALAGGRQPRASGALAFHVLEIMEAISTACRTGAAVDLHSRPERPQPMASATLEQE